MNKNLVVTHYPGCTPNYPEKIKTERPGELFYDVTDGFTVVTCVDCGAFATDLPAADDPYWEDVAA